MVLLCFLPCIRRFPGNSLRCGFLYIYLYMKVYRYMSKEELDLFRAGKTIVGHNHEGRRTDSVGVCFLGEKTRVSRNTEFDPLRCYEFLSGIVSRDILAEFETDVELQEGEGVYADPFGDYFDTILVKEYSIPEYSNKTFRLTRYCTGFGLYSYQPVWQSTEKECETA